MRCVTNLITRIWFAGVGDVPGIAGGFYRPGDWNEHGLGGKRFYEDVRDWFFC